VVCTLMLLLSFFLARIIFQIKKWYTDLLTTTAHIVTLVRFVLLVLLFNFVSFQPLWLHLK